MKLTHLLTLLLLTSFALIPAGRAQQKNLPPIIRSRAKVEPALPARDITVAPAPAPVVPVPAPDAPVTVAAAPAPDATAVPAPQVQVVPPGKGAVKGGIMLNF